MQAIVGRRLVQEEFVSKLVIPPRCKPAQLPDFGKFGDFGNLFSNESLKILS